MASHAIAVIPGDGIGPEIIAAALPILTKAAEKTGTTLEYTTCLAGGAALDAVGVPLPPETIRTAKKSTAVLLGAVGGPRWDKIDPASRPEKSILGLRKELELYANLRPVRVPACLTSASPLKEEVVAGADLMIVRELTGGMYFGPRKEAEDGGNPFEAWDTELYSHQEISRIIHMACRVARQRRHRITSVDKANVLASSRLWRKTADAIVPEYPHITLNHLYVDNCAMQLMLNPRQFDVIVTGNLFGDILSDEAAVLTGSIGLLPSASIGDGPGLYEPIHGSAPDIAGQGIANPIGTILSAAMLLRHSLHSDAAARTVEAAVDQVLAEGYRTRDTYQTGCIETSTEEMGRRIFEKL